MPPAPDRPDRPPLVIRRAGPADALEVAEVYLAAFHATYAFPLAQSDDEVRAWIRSEVVPATGTWVAEEDGRIAAMMVLDGGYIDQLYVRPGSWRRGIGSRLVALAKERRRDGLTLYTFQANAGARAFYERHGFAAAWFGDGSANDERQPDVRYEWRP